jgi:hypothetical protein
VAYLLLHRLDVPGEGECYTLVDHHASEDRGAVEHACESLNEHAEYPGAYLIASVSSSATPPYPPSGFRA